MGASLLWTLRFILFFVVICKQTTGDRATLDVPQHTVFLEERVTLICTGQDGKQLQFYKDGSLVQRDTQHLLLQGLNKAYLKMDFVSKSNEGLYSCGANEETHSPEKELKVTENTRRIELTVSNTDIPVGGSVTLSCDVEDWNGELQLLSVKAEDDSEIQNLGKEQTLSVTDRGVYYCRPWDRHVSTKRSNDVTVVDTAPTVSVSQLVFVGESLTLRCEVEGGADTEWTYHWSRNTLKLPPTTREYTVSRVTESDRGTYSCRAERGPHHITVWRNISVSVLNKPQVTVSGPSEVQTGGSLELLCSVSPSSSGWKYDWSRNEQLFKESSSEAQVTVSEGGEYQCRAHRGDPPYFTEDSHKFRLRATVSRASLSVEPPWPQLFPGEQLSLTCSAHGAGAEWTFEWSKSGQNLQHTQSEMTIRKAAVRDRGSYSCRGVLPHTVTEWSPPITLNVSNRAPRPVLSVSVSWLSPGASVSLSCAVTAPSAGWSFHWYRAVPQSQSDTYERLPGASAGSKQDSFSLQGLNNSAAFVCRAARGNPAFYSEYSDLSFVWSGDPESPVSLSVSPDRAQHFTDDVITLSCGFNSTGADRTVYRSFYKNRVSTQQCSNPWRKDKSKCEFVLREKTSAVFWCESGSGEMSNAVNISVHSDIILMSPVRAVTEGQPVSLSCKLNSGTFTSVCFYKNGKIIQNGTNPEFNISAVSRSDEGFYKCEGQMKLSQRSAPKTVVSAESWISVKTVPVSKGELSSLPVMLVVGPVCAVLLLILLLLLWRYKTKGESSSSENDEGQEGQDQQLYSSLLHGDICVYETIQNPGKRNDEELGDYSNLPLRCVQTEL